MAVDSRHKRAAAVALLLPFMFTANTDATLGVDAAERLAATWVYSGISAAEPAVSNRKLSFNLRNGSLSIGLANDQDVTSGASPTFDGANITGVLAANVDIADAGDIITATDVEDALQENRAAIDLNTTHAGSVGTDHGYIDQDVTITGTPTFGDVIIANGGTVGQAAGPLLTFDDTNNHLELTGAAFRHGTATNYYEMAVGSDGDLTITTVDSDGSAGDIILTPNGDVQVATGHLDILQGNFSAESPYEKQPYVTISNTRDDSVSAQLQFWKSPDTLVDDCQLGYIGAFSTRSAQPQSYIDFRQSDETSDHTGGEINLAVKIDDVGSYMIRLMGYNGAVGEAQVVLNDSAADVDFIIRKDTAGDALIYDAGADTTSIGDGGTTNYASFASDGELTLTGTARVERILESMVISGRGGSAPTERVAETPYLSFTFNIGMDVHQTFEAPYNMDYTYDSWIKVHWYSHLSQETDVVNWQAEWNANAEAGGEAVNAGSTTDTSGNVTCPAQWMIKETLIETIPGNSIAEGDIVGIAVERIGSTGAGVDPDNLSIHVLTIEYEYVSNKLGKGLT
jgi:hypothetical protein